MRLFFGTATSEMGCFPRTVRSGDPAPGLLIVPEQHRRFPQATISRRKRTSRSLRPLQAMQEPECSTVVGTRGFDFDTLKATGAPEKAGSQPKTGAGVAPRQAIHFSSQHSTSIRLGWKTCAEVKHQTVKQRIEKRRTTWVENPEEMIVFG